MSSRAPESNARAPYKDLRGYLALLERAGLLKRVKAQVDLQYEVGAICARSLDRKGPGILFENIKGYERIPLVTNILSTVEQVAVAFGTEPDDRNVCEAIERGMANPIPPRVVEAGPCQEEVHTGEEVNVQEFPTPWWHESDGGQYVGTTAGVITADPETGYINMGLYRVMIKDKNTLTVNMKGSHPIGEVATTWQGRHGGHIHVLKNEARGKATPVAIAIGMDPLLTYVGAQGVPSDEFKHAEYAVAGAWRGEPVELVPCRTSDLLVPAWAEVILEGEVLANERASEGPHGESQGFYNSVERAFSIKVKCITHRKNPIIYGLICRPQEDYPKFLFSGVLGEKLKGVDIIKEVYVPEAIGGGLGLMAIVAAKVESPDDVEKVVAAVHNAPGESLRKKPRWLIIVDDDCDVKDWNDVMWRVALAVMPDRDVRIGPRTDPIFHEPLAGMHNYVGSSIVVDATFRSKKSIVDGKEVRFPRVNRVSKELRSKIESRWKEYGLD